MFSNYDSSSFSEIDDALKKLDPSDREDYEQAIARLEKADRDHLDHKYPVVSYESLLFQLRDTTKEMAFYKSQYDQERKNREAAEGLLLPALILLCGFFFPIFVTAMHGLLSVVLCLAAGLAFSLFGVLYALLISDHLQHRFPEFYLLYKASDKALLVFFAALPSIVLLVSALIDRFHA